MVLPGDIYGVRVPDGRYAAVRVIRRVGKSSLVLTCPYLANKRPRFDDPLLRKAAIINGIPAKEWLDGEPPQCFELLGNILPSKAESKAECSVYGGKWGESSGFGVFLQWRWRHDRRAMEAEVRDRYNCLERNRHILQNPNAMMAERKFWSLIDLIDWKCQSNTKKLAPAREVLAARSKADICRFEERLAFLLYRLDTEAHAVNLGKDLYNPKSGYVSPDGFLYARCLVVAKGKAFYHAVLNDPSRMPKGLGFESLLELATSAYEMKTGDPLEYSTGCNYESFSNPSGWDVTTRRDSTLAATEPGKRRRRPTSPRRRYSGKVKDT